MNNDALIIAICQSLLDVNHINHRIGVINHSCSHYTLLVSSASRANHLIEIASVRFDVLNDDASTGHAAQHLFELLAVWRVAGNQERHSSSSTLGRVDSDSGCRESHGNAQIKSSSSQNEDVCIRFLVRLSLVSFHERLTKCQLSGDFIQIKFVLIVPVNDLIADDIVGFFSVVVSRFDECWYREVLEIAC